MNIQPTPATAAGITASIAGVGRAAAHGGEHEKQVAEAARQQNTAEKPAGTTTDVASVDAGDAAGDRGGDGRQAYDFFEKHEHPDDESPANDQAPTGVSPADPSYTEDSKKLNDEPPPHLDFRA